MANTARGEAEIVLGDKSYTVVMNMGALARMATLLGVKKFAELQTRLVECNLPDMPLVVQAILAANGHKVDPADIESMDPIAYFEQLIPAIFRRDEEKAAAGEPANPTSSQATATSP